jgi:hypothetical protein
MVCAVLFFMTPVSALMAATATAMSGDLRQMKVRCGTAALLVCTTHCYAARDSIQHMLCVV